MFRRYLTMQWLIVVRDTRDIPTDKSDKFCETSRRRLAIIHIQSSAAKLFTLLLIAIH